MNEMKNQPEALRLAELIRLSGALPGSVSDTAASELRRLHAENQDLRTRHYCNTAEIESLQHRVQELGEMARENRSKRIVELEGRIAEMEEQLSAIGAGGVEPLRKTSADTSALRAALEEAEAALEVATSRLSARGANYPVHVTSEARALEIVRKALGKSQPDHFRDATKMVPAALTPARHTQAVNQPLTQVPPFTALAQHKLDDLLAQGFRITGYAIERADVADWAPQRGFVTHGGLVGWWTPHQIDRIPGAQQGQPT